MAMYKGNVENTTSSNFMYNVLVAPPYVEDRMLYVSLGINTPCFLFKNLEKYKMPATDPQLFLLHYLLQLPHLFS